MPSFLFVILPIVCESPSSSIPRVLYHIHSHILESVIPKSVLNGYWVYTFREKCPLHDLNLNPSYEGSVTVAFGHASEFFSLFQDGFVEGCYGYFIWVSDMVRAYDFT